MNTKDLPPETEAPYSTSPPAGSLDQPSIQVNTDGVRDKGQKYRDKDKGKNKGPGTYRVTQSGHNGSYNDSQKAGMTPAQQQFVLKFCRQLASVINACDQSESAEIEVGRRKVGTQQVKVKLRAEREQ